MSIFLQSNFIFSTLIEQVSIETGLDIAVGGGVDFLIIDTIEDAEETFTARTQQVIKLFAEGWGQNLLSIAFTNSRHGISEENATSHNIDYMSQLSNLRIEKAVGSDPSDLKNTIAKD